VSRDSAPLNSSRFLTLARSGYRGDIGAIITESVAEQVKQQVETWARKFDAPKFVAKLERGLERNNGLLERGITQLENS
jgi:hypothetical protein